MVIFDGYADWEPASALAELRRTFRFSVQALGLSRNSVTSRAGSRFFRKLRGSENTHDLARRFPNSDLIIYPDAGHGFASSKDPQVFRREDAKDADARTDAFFRRVLGK